MNFESIVALIAQVVDEQLPEGNPWKGNVTGTVAEPKESLNTWSVVHCVGEPRELVAGNATMQVECRVYGQLVPTEGEWSAAEVVSFADELSAALVAGADELIFPMPRGTTEQWVVLGVQPHGAARMQADKEVGYVVSQPFLLTVQF